MQSSPRQGSMAARTRRAPHTLELVERRQLLAAHITGSATIYSTIQAAVDAAPSGGVVTVDSGTYSELVFIDKPLTLQGAQAGVDGRSPTRGTNESVLNGTTTADGITSSIFISANDVTVDGFVVQGNTS